ncbi:hypothetical protein AFERRI_200003 [Acidithiobacillus ferrivorans]|uniref:Uncharacterized protein n=1 Tax=Acidithiobacillus ferrivorans TaxID=160808 RepID=A0A060UQR2_9PROT|nr:hypothetical protein AFERRI_200003 [Acidithiobacillus ferrivorans]
MDASPYTGPAAGSFTQIPIWMPSQKRSVLFNYTLCRNPDGTLHALFWCGMHSKCTNIVQHVNGNLLQIRCVVAEQQ